MRPVQIPTADLKVLCLGAHPDDIEIGVGATLLTLQQTRASVVTVVATGAADRQDESAAALNALSPGSTQRWAGLPDGRLPAHWNQLKEFLEDVATDAPVDLIFAPREDDAHQDHRTLGTIAATVWRGPLILHYEIPKWDGDMASPTHYVQISSTIARRKVEILNECFTSQRNRAWWDDETFMGLMRLRGIECQSRYAEGFWTRKMVIDFDQPAEHDA